MLFVSPTTRHVSQLEEHGATVVPFTRGEPFTHLPYNALRFFLYLEWLRHNGGAYRRVLLTDVRDVVFQHDPFAYDWPPGLSVFHEDLSMTIGQCPHMERWIKGHLGGAVFTALRDEHIVCSGTTVGDCSAIISYLEALTARLEPFAPGERMAGYDQGVHNLLIHGNFLEMVTCFDNSGPVLTLGYKRGGAPLNGRGEILAENGAAAFLVHQYDRHPELFRHVRRLWA